MSGSLGFDLLARELASAQKELASFKVLSISDAVLYAQLLGRADPAIVAQAPYITNRYEALALLLKYENARLKHDNQFLEFAQKDRESNEGKQHEVVQKYTAHLEGEAKKVPLLEKRRETLQQDLIHEVRTRQGVETELDHLKKRLKTMETEMQDVCTARIRKARDSAMDEIHVVWETLCAAWRKDNPHPPSTEIVEALDTIRSCVARHLV